jgi:hypothetical protein
MIGLVIIFNMRSVKNMNIKASLKFANLVFMPAKNWRIVSNIIHPSNGIKLLKWNCREIYYHIVRTVKNAQIKSE